VRSWPAPHHQTSGRKEDSQAGELRRRRADEGRQRAADAERQDREDEWTRPEVVPAPVPHRPPPGLPDHRDCRPPGGVRTAKPPPGARQRYVSDASIKVTARTLQVRCAR
jgi:hypothetical protein